MKFEAVDVAVAATLLAFIAVLRCWYIAASFYKPNFWCLKNVMLLLLFYFGCIMIIVPMHWPVFGFMIIRRKKNHFEQLMRTRKCRRDKESESDMYNGSTIWTAAPTNTSNVQSEIESEKKKPE